jgi:DNA-binding NarL/FixJ family response regulator
MRREPYPTVLVGPSALIREGITRILSPTRFRILGSASCVGDLLDLRSQYGSLLLVIDSGDDVTSSTEQIKLFKERYPAGRIAVLADRYQSTDVVSAYQAGANAYLAKIAACNVLIKSLELVVLGETILPSAILSSICGSEHLDERDGKERDDTSSRRLRIPDDPRSNVMMPKLSLREKRILRCLLDGDANKVIARKVDITEGTVKIHVKTILRKIRVQNRTQAAIWAMCCGLFSSEIEDRLISLKTTELSRHSLPQESFPHPSGDRTD